MTGARQRQMSPHSVEILEDQIVKGPGMGTKHVWESTGQFTDCLIQPISASNDVALSAPQTRATYRVRWTTDPGLNSLIHRLLVVTPAKCAGKVLRIAPVTDASLKGWLFTSIAQEWSEDQQIAPALLGPQFGHHARSQEDASLGTVRLLVGADSRGDPEEPPGKTRRSRGKTGRQGGKKRRPGRGKI